MATRYSGSHEHRRHSRGEGSVPIGIVTVSDSRTAETDTNGMWLREQVETLGHRVGGYRVVQDDPEQVVDALAELTAGKCRVVVFNGGTGISKRDRTYDALSSRLEKTLSGFGELFRMLSYEQVGAAAMFSRATAGVYRDTVVISIPGSPAAVQLAWERLIAPELQHLAWEVGR